MRSLSLEEALALAVATSEDVEVARAGVQRARANVARTESQGKPQVNASGSYQRSLASQFEGIGGGDEQPEVPPDCVGAFTPDPNLPLEERVSVLERRLGCPETGGFAGLDFSQLGFGAPNTWNFGLGFNWAFFTGGRVEAQASAAEELAEIAVSNVSSAEAQTRLDVTTAYFDAQLAAELVEIAEGSLANAEETLRITSLRAREGAQADFDVLQARVTRDNQRPVLIRRRTVRSLAFDRLRALLDLPEEQELRLTTPVTEAASRTVEANADAGPRAAVQQAANRLEAAEHQLDAARAQRMPTISAQSQYGLVAYSDSLLPDLGGFRKNWTVGAAIQLPLYAGGRITADIEAARADVAEAEAQLDQMVELAQLDTSSATAEVAAARAAYEATEGTVEQAVRGYELAQLRYAEGVSIPLEVQNARFLLEQARVNRAQAARDLWVAQTRLELLPFLPLGGAPAAQFPQQAAPQVQMPQGFSVIGTQIPGGMQ
ncbi:MAG TPA: TolC family protein [Thermoanaerobaculia bacterium]|nr:TolC family protein [Thermoanaerobaculia bacterium]